MKTDITEKLNLNIKHVIYSRAEEKFNFITHLVGAAISIIAIVILTFIAWHNKSIKMFISFMIYGFSLLILYLSSTLYHSGFSAKTRHFFRIADHCSIFLLIAGTYTPIALIGIGGNTGKLIITIIWTCAIIGITYKFFFVHKYNFISTIVYLGMGLLCVCFAKEIMNSLSNAALIWLLIGGIFYITGITFYLWNKLHHNHGIWHIFVLCGSIAHFICIILLPTPH